MAEITLTDEQRTTLVDRVRAYADYRANAAGDGDELGEDRSTPNQRAQWQRAMGEADEAAEPWRELADHLERGNLLLPDPVTVQQLSEVFDNEAWDPDWSQDQTPEHLRSIVATVGEARRRHNTEMPDMPLASELREADETPLIADLAERIREETHGLTSWNIQKNDVSAQVFEFKDHRRLQVWDEANFMGDIDGYSWQEQLWSGSEWVDVTAISTENDTPPLSVDELLLDRLHKFRMDAELTHPESLTPREAALDRMARNAIGTSAEMARKVEQIEKKLSTFEGDLRSSEKENGKVRSALIALAQRITAPTERQRSAPENTGPATSSSPANPTGPAL